MTRGIRLVTKAPAIGVHTFTSRALPRKYLHPADIEPFACFQRIGDEGLFIPMVADIGYAMGPPTAASQSVKQVGVEGSDPTDTDTERGGSADEAKKVIRLQYFELNPDLDITPTDCESRNENKLTWQCRRGRRRGPSRFSHAADVQVSPLTTAGVMRAMLRTKKHKVRACLLSQHSFVWLEYHRK